MAVEVISLEADAAEYAERVVPRDVAAMSAEIRELACKRKAVILNPGSDYSTGALNGALVSLSKDRADAQLVRG